MSSSEAIHFLEKRMKYIHSQVSKESLEAGADTMLTIEEAKNYINKELSDVNKNRKEGKENDNNFHKDVVKKE